MNTHKGQVSRNDRRQASVKPSQNAGHNHNNKPEARREFAFRTKATLVYGFDEKSGADHEVGVALVAAHPEGDVTLLEVFRAKDAGTERVSIPLNWRLSDGDNYELVTVYRYGSTVFFQTFVGYKLHMVNSPWRSYFPDIRKAAGESLKTLQDLTGLKLAINPQTRYKAQETQRGWAMLMAQDVKARKVLREFAADVPFGMDLKTARYSMAHRGAAPAVSVDLGAMTPMKPGHKLSVTPPPRVEPTEIRVQIQVPGHPEITDLNWVAPAANAEVAHA